MQDYIPCTVFLEVIHPSHLLLKASYNSDFGLTLLYDVTPSKYSQDEELLTCRAIGHFADDKIISNCVFGSREFGARNPVSNRYTAIASNGSSRLSIDYLHIYVYLH